MEVRLKTAAGVNEPLSTVLPARMMVTPCAHRFGLSRAVAGQQHQITRTLACFADALLALLSNGSRPLLGIQEQQVALAMCRIGETFGGARLGRCAT